MLQRAGTALLSLRAACSPVETLLARSYAKRAAGAAGAAARELGVPSAAAEQRRAAAAEKQAKQAAREAAAAEAAEGAKAKLFRILQGADAPMTKTQVWELAEAEGLKSKRFTKQMLNEMRKAKWIRTRVLPGVANKQSKRFAYFVDAPRQQQRAAALERRSSGGQAAAAAGA